MRRRIAVFAVLLFFILAPAVLLSLIVSVAGPSNGRWITLALCALVLLIFALVAAVVADRFVRNPVCAPRPAATDRLTALFVREAAEEQVRSLLSHPSRETCVLILADIQGFRTVNEQLGHLEGDRLLRDLADALRGLFPGETIAGRIGPDSFLLFVPGMPPKEAQSHVSERLAFLASRWSVLLPRGSAKLALGAAFSPVAEARFEALFLCADRALVQCRENKSAFELHPSYRNAAK